MGIKFEYDVVKIIDIEFNNSFNSKQISDIYYSNKNNIGLTKINHNRKYIEGEKPSLIRKIGHILRILNNNGYVEKYSHRFWRKTEKFDIKVIRNNIKTKYQNRKLV
ncbi:MAG: hypothetical protein ACFFG0_07580 [Candidatus Thorarchaeota archaeon]